MTQASMPPRDGGCHPTHDLPDRIGIIAGQGDFPLLIAKAARESGIEVVAVAISGFASPEIDAIASRTEWVELGQVGRTLAVLRENDVTAVAMAGRVPHASIFQYRHFDVRAMKLLAKAVTRKADALLGVVTQELEAEGIRVLDSSLFLKSLMPLAGLLTPARPLDERELADADFGFPLARQIAGLDIGQTIVVKELVVVAVEGLEGTDECITRAGQLAGAGCVVVKVSKPGQDLRFDIPIVGRTTLKRMRNAGCSALVISAGESLLFDREEVLRIAAEADIAIVARPSPD